MRIRRKTYPDKPAPSKNSQGGWHRTTLPILARCFGYLRPHQQYVVGIYLAVLLINTVNILVPQFIRWIVDQGIFAGDRELLQQAVFGLLGVTLLKGLLVFFQGKWSEVASQSVAYDLRNAVHRKLTELSFSFHDRTEAGQILSRTIQDVERIRFLTGRAILRLTEGTVLLVGTVGILIWMNPSLGGLMILILPLLIYRAYVFGREFRPLSIRIQNQLGVLTTRLEQNLRGARVVKSFAQEEAEIERFLRENEAWFDLSARSVRLEAVNVPMLDLLANLGTALVLFYGGRLVIQGDLTLGELVAFTTYLGQLVRPIQLIGRVIPVLAIAASAGERVFAILDEKPEVADRPGAFPLPRIQGHVRFENVSFGYQNGSTVLKDVSFEAQPGQVIALLGATGAGKSTVINMVTRFYEPTRGQVLVDGYDIGEVRLKSLRDQIGIVLQDTILFAATIGENIAFGRPETPQEAIIQAARDAQAHDFIMATSQGYATRVGERGMTLSGGQKQRLAIARALLTDPRILILDDATSSVDTQTERKIQLALERLMEGRTTFVIAHRLSTVRRADVILVMEKGVVVAQGTHETLLRTSPLYQEIYRLQLRPQEFVPLPAQERPEVRV